MLSNCIGYLFHLVLSIFCVFMFQTCFFKYLLLLKFYLFLNETKMNIFNDKKYSSQRR